VHGGGLEQLLKAELELPFWEFKGPEYLCQVYVILKQQKHAGTKTHNTVKRSMRSTTPVSGGGL